MICAWGCGIRWLASLAFFSAAAAAGAQSSTGGPAENPGWARVLGSVGLDLAPGPPSFVLLEGDSPQSRQWGFRPTGKSVRVASVEELGEPKLEVVWQKPVTAPLYELPPGARVFTREKWTGAPLVAGMRRDGKAVLWTITDIGERGYERFPYLLHALHSLGIEFPFRGGRTWAFFDDSYRLRADSDFLARRWRKAGIAAIHAAAWHFYEPDAGRDEYLRKLIEACHRQGILVYAWLELPHISEQFWEEHPQWREKTATQQDAHLDWRKLMNLADPNCSQAAEAGLRALLNRFDWDGVNLAELYFESLYGPSAPDRFTPMNDVVRADFRAKAGFDPIELFRQDSPRYWERDRAAWKRFADYRASLTVRLQQRWLQAARGWKPDLDLVLTHIDDRFDAAMRDNLGADAARLLPFLGRLDFTFAVEDPATVWDLGPERYAEIARRYARLTRRLDKLAVDINIVPRYQDVYPTKKQVGSELFQLLHGSSQSFARVLLYFEESIGAADYDLLAAASAAVSRFEIEGQARIITAAQTAGVRWQGPARVDGRPWPALDGSIAWIPAGRRRIERDPAPLRFHLLWLNADLIGARALPDGVELQYRSSARAPALVDFRPGEIEIDGRPAEAAVIEAEDHFVVLLPPGQRRARISAAR
jgi:hypothetical protein